VAFFRRERLPEGTSVEPGEKVLGWGRGPQGVLVATDIALYTPEAFEPRRTVWHLIDKAVWRKPNLDVSLHASVGAPLMTWKFELTEANRLPTAVRDRVTASVITSIDIDVPGGQARIAARRTETNETRWSVNALDGADLSNPDSRAQITAVIAELRETLGL
jgi:hypothetical protein